MLPQQWGQAMRPNDERLWAEYDLAYGLAERGDEEGLRAQADKGSYQAQNRLANLLGTRAAVSELKNLAHAASAGATEELIRLYKRDRPDGSHIELDINAEPRPIM
jgi:hypothetical protein